jgi:hypothetical protein
LLGELTFKTSFLALSFVEAKALVDQYQVHSVTLIVMSSLVMIETGSLQWQNRKIDSGQYPSPSSAPRSNCIRDRIAKELQRAEYKAGAFVRLSSRSPKDGK